jgi:hypothetical protein
MNELGFINHWQLGMGPMGSVDHNSQKLQWCAPDTYENFIKNPFQNYTEHSIIYNFNSQGFRTQEFELNSHKKNILFLGCSHTLGVGLRDSEVWVHKVSQLFDRSEYNCYNLGIGGSGADTVARLLTNSIDYIHPSIVFILWPTMLRIDQYLQFQDKKSHKIISRVLNFKMVDQPKDILDLFSDFQCYNLMCKNKLIVNLLEKIYKFKTISIDACDIKQRMHVQQKYTRAQTRGARDGIHWGPQIHQEIADQMIQQYKEIVNNAG